MARIKLETAPANVLDMGHLFSSPRWFSPTDLLKGGREKIGISTVLFLARAAQLQRRRRFQTRHFSISRKSGTKGPVNHEAKRGKRAFAAPGPGAPPPSLSWSRKNRSNSALGESTR
jgi:hypothetical protein